MRDHERSRCQRESDGHGKRCWERGWMTEWVTQKTMLRWKRVCGEEEKGAGRWWGVPWWFLGGLVFHDSRLRGTLDPGVLRCIGFGLTEYISIASLPEGRSHVEKLGEADALKSNLRFGEHMRNTVLNAIIRSILWHHVIGLVYKLKQSSRLHMKLAV